MKAAVLFLLYASSGILGGCLTGLIGAGCGLILLPTLIHLFPLNGMLHDLAVHMALGTTLAVLSFNCVVATLSHRHFGQLNLDLILRAGPFCALGATLGAVLSSVVPVDAIKHIFIVVVCLLGSELLLRNHQTRMALHGWRLPVISFCSACFASLVGASIGSMLIPVLHRSGIAIRQAIPTSISCGIFYTSFATVAYIVTGMRQHEFQLPPWSLGYVYLPAFFTITSTVLFATHLATRMSQKISETKIKLLFALVLFWVALEMYFT